jgi:hypothetical protein
MNILSRHWLLKLTSAACLLLLPLALAGQIRRRDALTKPTPRVIEPGIQPAAPLAEPTPPAEPVKRNGRADTKTNARPANDAKIEPAKQAVKDPAYFYEFDRPEFVVAKVVIEHDEDGRGTISFQKKDFDEMETDPLVVSEAALKRINDSLTSLNFVDSTENYQYEKDYSHLGNITLRITKGGKVRTAKFNWTLNKDAKALMDEYRKLSNQYVWKFDITVARVNQPLDAPRLMDEFNSLYRRNELSDPKQMIPFLQQLGNDERIPLIARNHATKLVREIEKAKK